MRLSPHLIWIINMFMLISFLFFMFITYKLKGKKIIVLTGYTSVILVLSWLFSWALASLWILIPASTMSKLLATTYWYAIINQMIWFVIVLIVMTITAIFIQLRLNIKGPKHLNQTLDSIISVIFALTTTLITWVMVGLIVASPLFINGRTLLNQSWLKHVVGFTVEIMGGKAAPIYQDDLIQKIVGSEQLSDEEVVRLEQSLETLGLSKDLSKAVTKVVTQQELSDQEVTAVKDYIVAADLSDEEVVSVLDQIRLPEHKIIEYMEKLDYSEETIQRLLDKKKE
jgi:hypothetical protein